MIFFGLTCSSFKSNVDVILNICAVIRLKKRIVGQHVLLL
jgi:hypothetical protein